jgi:hypothetical protein
LTRRNPYKQTMDYRSKFSAFQIKKNKCWLQFLRSLHPPLGEEVPTRWNYVLIGYKKFQENVDYVLKL